MAQATITKLHRTVEDARTAYSSVLAYFCQDSSLKSEDFFAFVINFLDALESTHRAQEEKREREKNKKKKEGEMTAIKKTSCKGGGSEGGGIPQDGDHPQESEESGLRISDL